MTKSKSGCRVVVAEHFGLVNDQQKRNIRIKEKKIKIKKTTIHDFSRTKKKNDEDFSVH